MYRGTPKIAPECNFLGFYGHVLNKGGRTWVVPNQKPPKLGRRFPWVSVRELKHQEVGWGIGTQGCILRFIGWGIGTHGMHSITGLSEG